MKQNIEIYNVKVLTKEESTKTNGGSIYSIGHAIGTWLREGFATYGERGVHTQYGL